LEVVVAHFRIALFGSVFFILLVGSLGKEFFQKKQQPHEE
jgi:hypothetical protein